MLSETKKMHVLVLPSFYPMKYDFPRGSFFEEQSRMLQRAGVDIAVVFNENRSIKNISWPKFRHAHFQRSLSRESGLPVLRRRNWNIIPTRYNLGKKIWIRNSIKLVEYFLAKNPRPDLIHVHCTWMAGIVALEIKKRYGIPYLLTEHSTHIEIEMREEDKEIYREVLAGAEKILVVSNPLKNLLMTKLMPDVSAISVVPNFIDFDFFNPEHRKKPESNQYRLFTVCFLDTKKRVDRLIDAFAEIVKKIPCASLRIGGDGGETENLKQQVAALGLQSQIAFLGFLSKEEVKSELNQADLFVLPSEVETFGVVVIEAMAMGIPVVATRSGGPEDVITEISGELANRDTMSLVEAIYRAHEKRDCYDHGKIREEARKKFSREVVSKKYLEFYAQAIN